MQTFLTWSNAEGKHVQRRVVDKILGAFRDLRLIQNN